MVINDSDFIVMPVKCNDVKDWCHIVGCEVEKACVRGF